MVQGYCFKCKKKVDIKDLKYELNSINRAIVRGTCSVCGGKVYKILSDAETPADLKAKRDKAKKGGAQRKSRKTHATKGSRKSKKSKTTPKRKSRRKSRKSTK